MITGELKVAWRAMMRAGDPAHPPAHAPARAHTHYGLWTMDYGLSTMDCRTTGLTMYMPTTDVLAHCPPYNVHRPGRAAVPLEHARAHTHTHYGLWTMDYGLAAVPLEHARAHTHTHYGLWTMDYGLAAVPLEHARAHTHTLWTMDYGLWTIDCGLSTMVYPTMYMSTTDVLPHYPPYNVHRLGRAAVPLEHARAHTHTHYGLWTMDYGLWTMDYRLSTMVYPWSTRARTHTHTMDYGLWTMAYRLWCTPGARARAHTHTMDYGLWTMDYGLSTVDCPIHD